MFKAVLFDLDNTLIDFMAMKNAACDAAIYAMIDAGLELEHDKARKILFELYESIGIENQLVFNKFLEKVTGKVDFKILANAIIAYRHAKQTFTIPYPKTRSVLMKIKSKGIKLGVVSDAPRLNAWLRLAEMQLGDYFDVVVTLGDSKKLKPAPNSFKLALKELRLRPEEVLFVGDNPNRDILGAKKIGMKTCLAKYGQKNYSKGYAHNKNARIRPDFQISKINELLKIVKYK